MPVLASSLCTYRMLNELWNDINSNLHANESVDIMKKLALLTECKCLPVFLCKMLHNLNSVVLFLVVSVCVFCMGSNF